MNISEMHVMGDIEAYRKSIGMSYAKLAELMGKDSAVVKRQLTETRGGVQLNTAYEIAAALGGEVRFIAPETAQDLAEEERKSLNEQITVLVSVNAKQETEIAKLTETVSLLQNRVIAKDTAISRKDDLIRQLLIEKGVIKPQQD